MSDRAPETTVVVSSKPELPPELREALIELLAQALVAELLDTRKCAAMQAEKDDSVVSPSGSNHLERQPLDPAS